MTQRLRRIMLATQENQQRETSMVVAAMSRVGILLFPLLVLAVALSGMPDSVIVAEAEPDNIVRVYFTEELIHYPSGDTFTNKEVTGTSRWRVLQPVNEADATGAPVRQMRVTLASEQMFQVKRDRLTRMGPPVYEWSIGDIAEGMERPEWPWDGFVDAPSAVTFTPGIDVSRSFDRTEFLEPGIQKLTLSITPRAQWIEEVEIFVHTDENELVDPVILSIPPGNGGRVMLTPDGRRSGVLYTSVEINTPLTIIYTIQVTPKKSFVEFQPYTAIDFRRVDEPTRNVTQGSSFSYTNEAGTWTVRAEGSYVWHRFASSPAHSIVFLESTIHDEGTTSTPDNGISSTPEDSGNQILIGIVAGAVIIIGLGIYTFVRRRLRNRVHKADSPS